MFAVIYLPNFALQAALRHEPELWPKPVALFDPALSTPRICAVTQAAQLAGVAEGLTPTQALARCRDVLVRHRLATQEAAATAALVGCAFGFSPQIENTAPGVCTLNLNGLAMLKCADSPRLLAWAERVCSTLSALNLSARVGLGATPSVSRYAACWPLADVGLPSEISIVAHPIQLVRQPGPFIAALPVAALEPSTDVASILQKWGVRTVGELLALGPAALAERIGLEALALFASASSTTVRPLRLARPSERFEESFAFEQEVETIEPLLFILRRFVDQLSRRLELAGFVAELLTLRLRLESGRLVERRLRLPQPARHPDILFRMLHTHLETLRTDAAVVEVALTADPTRPEQKQFGLFETALRDPHQFQDTLANLCALLGADRVGTPVRENSHRSDAFKLVPPDFENAPSLRQERAGEFMRAPPLRRIRPSVKAKVRSETEHGKIGLAFFPEPGAGGLRTNPVPRGRMRTGGFGEASAPVSIQCQIAKGKLKIAVGPWRASGHWWEPGAWQREEWDVEMSDGSVYRLNRDQDGWHVEGVLD